MASVTDKLYIKSADWNQNLYANNSFSFSWNETLWYVLSTYTPSVTSVSNTMWWTAVDNTLNMWEVYSLYAGAGVWVILYDVTPQPQTYKIVKFVKNWVEYCVPGSWSSAYVVDFLLVGWGWGWWGYPWWASWWWGAWWLLECCWFNVDWDIGITIWWWWAWWNSSVWYNWWNSMINFWCYNYIIAFWWWGWNGGVAQNCHWWQDWGSWWWNWFPWVERCWYWCPWQWNNWWAYLTRAGWWGWWAWCAWCDWIYWWKNKCCWWNWWIWIQNNFSWTNVYYSWWWWWTWLNWHWVWWCWWWWNWDSNTWCNATFYWWWWWAWLNSWWWAWCQWIAIIRYPTACWYDMSGWCKYTCGDYTIHCFTSDGTLSVN